LESSAATDKHDMEFSSMVCIELNTKKLLSRTTKAKIFESWVWFFYKEPLPSVSKSTMCIFLFFTNIGFPQIHIPYVQLLVEGLILNYNELFKIKTLLP